MTNVRGQVLASYWNPELHSAIVVKKTPYGNYTGISIAEEEDADITNEWDGYRFAECKCDMKYLKERSKRMYERYLGIKMAYNNLSQTEPTSAGAAEMLDKLKRQMHIAKRDAEQARQEYEHRKETYVSFTDAVLAERRRLQEWKKKREEKIGEPAGQ